MGLGRLSLAIVAVRDYQGMKDWYSKVLGLEITEESDEGEWSTFRLPEGGAEFAVHGGMSEVDGSPNKVVPAIEVDDIRATVEDLRGRGVEVMSEPVDPGHGSLLANIRDPEGNIINLYEPMRGGHGS